MTRAFCFHCGLPVFTPQAEKETIFCCHACRFASHMVKAEDGEGVRSFTLLRLALGSLLAANVMMVSILLYTGHGEPAVLPMFRWLLLLLSFPVMIILVYPFTVGTFHGALRGHLGLDALIAIGSITAFTVSAVHTIQGAGPIFFDTATMLPVLVTVGKLLEVSAKRETGKIMHYLETLIPATAVKLVQEKMLEVPSKEIVVGDVLRVLPGQRFPSDGIILEGITELHEAAFTGEFLPRVCRPGDEVMAGTVNGTGMVTIRAVGVGSKLLIHRIIEMVEHARTTISPMERLAEKVSVFFVPLVILVALVTGIFWGLENFMTGASVALAVVVVACPCALGIATPLATSLALGRAARSGIVVRGADILEAVGRSTVIFFDKTGTVTFSASEVRDIVSFDPEVTENEIVGWLASLEAVSSHPFAQVVVEEARKRSLELGHIIYMREFPGEGIRGMVSWRGVSREIIAGSAEFVRSAVSHPLAPYGAAASVINVAWGGKIHGRLVFQDPIRHDARETVAELKKAGIATVLLSGDSAAATELVGREIGINTIEAPRRPHEKIEVIRAAREACERTVMIGDGINDAPALAAADVGIAIGSGTELAKQAGNVVILGNGLGQVPWLVELSRFTRLIIKQNLAWAFGYNLIMIGIAGAGLLHPLLAAVAMVVSSISVLLNSLRIVKFKDSDREKGNDNDKEGDRRLRDCR